MTLPYRVQPNSCQPPLEMEALLVAEPESVGRAIDLLCSVNWQLWQAEDRARANDYANAREEKRLIDRLNLRRNQLVQRIDELLLALLALREQ